MRGSVSPLGPGELIFIPFFLPACWGIIEWANYTVHCPPWVPACAVNRPCECRGVQERPQQGPSPFPPSPAGKWAWPHFLPLSCSAPASLTRVTVVLLVAGNTAALGTESGSVFFLDLATLTLLEEQTLSPDAVLRR